MIVEFSNYSPILSIFCQQIVTIICRQLFASCSQTKFLQSPNRKWSIFFVAKNSPSLPIYERLLDTPKIKFNISILIKYNIIYFNGICMQPICQTQRFYNTTCEFELPNHEMLCVELTINHNKVDYMSLP